MKIKHIIQNIFLLGTLFSLVSCGETATWLDGDGTVLGTTPIKGGTPEEFPLPVDTLAWDYVDWTRVEGSDSGNVTYIANRSPKTSYFVGNVFQILVYDLAHHILSTGSGFIFNSSGWFITNYHVMEQGCIAEALFEIPDTTLGEAYTTLNIELASYADKQEDLFIGRIVDYWKIQSDHYRTLAFQTEYNIGDTTYSVGFPTSSKSLEIHSGVVVEDISSLEDEMDSDLSFIGSTSYMATGSGGGLLLNNRLEVLGMTTSSLFNGTGFVLGGAIEASNYEDMTQNVQPYQLQDFNQFLHPDELEYIRFFKSLEKYDYTEKTETPEFVVYTFLQNDEEITDDNDTASTTTEVSLCSDYWIDYRSVTTWGCGDTRDYKLYGFYSPTERLDSLTFTFTYTIPEGAYYSVYSNNINYSSTLSLTLNDYVLSYTLGTTVSTASINYAKQVFNSVYSFLSNWLINHA